MGDALLQGISDPTGKAGLQLHIISPSPTAYSRTGEFYKMKKGKLFLDIGPLQKPVGTDLGNERIEGQKRELRH